MTIGYTAGVFDLFHIGHLTLLKNAKGLCDKLIVGVTVDELVTYKGKRAIIPFSDRIEIVRSIKYVDAAVPQYDMDKLTTVSYTHLEHGSICRRRHFAACWRFLEPAPFAVRPRGNAPMGKGEDTYGFREQTPRAPSRAGKAPSARQEFAAAAHCHRSGHAADRRSGHHHPPLRLGRRG